MDRSNRGYEMGQFHWKPDTYPELIRSEVPRYDELQEQAIAAIPFPPERVLELGMGTGETTRRLIEAYPDAWVIGVLSIHHLRAEQKQNLFRQVRAQARSFVIGDIVKAETQVTPIDQDYDFPETADDLAEWSGGEIAWQADDLAVVRAVY